MNIQEIYQKAFNIVKNPETWTQNTMCRDKDGMPTYPTSKDACQWCSLGALAYALGTNELYKNDLFHTIYGKFFVRICYSLSKFNDKHTHAEVVELWEDIGKRNGWL